MREWKIALTPRQRSVYDVLWLLTGHSQHPWVGILHVDGLLLEQVDAAARALKEMGVIDWTLNKRVRVYSVMVPPEGLAGRPSPRRQHRSKLIDAPPVGRDTPRTSAGVSRTYAINADQSHYGTRPDDGSFSAAFVAAFPRWDYRGSLARKATAG